MIQRIAILFCVWFLWCLTDCASTQVDGSDVSSNANEVLRLERVKKQLEEEERKRAETMLEAQRIRAEAERQREAQRQAELKAEKARLEEAQREQERRQNESAEEERKKSLQTQQEDSKRIEAARLEEQRREEERKAEESRRLEEERRRVLEQKRRARENLLSRTDPDRMSFFRREMEEELADLDCTGSRGTVRIYRNKRPLQFFGSGRDVESADVDRPVPATRLSRSIHEKGDYVPLLGDGTSLLECKADSLMLRLLNIKADGQGNFWLLLEDQKGLLYTVLREDLNISSEAN